MTRPTPGPARPHPLDDVLVFSGRPLREGVCLEDTARFSDDCWPLAPATLQQQQYGWGLYFTTIPATYRLAAKQLCYALLSGDLPPGEPRVALATVTSNFYRLRVFLNWLDRRPAGQRRVRPLSELTPSILEDYQRYLLTTYPGRHHRDTHRVAVRYLWRYRHLLGEHGLPFDPKHLPGWNEPGTGRPAENTTDRIPEQVHGPLLIWSLRFIDDFAPDIIGAISNWRALRGPTRAAGATGRGRNNGLHADLRRYLDGHLADGRPLPGYHGKPNLNRIASHVGCAVRSVLRYQGEVDAAAAIVGVTPYGRVDVPVTGHLDGQTWVDDIATEPKLDNGVSTLGRMLQAACYVVIAFLSGMRDSEVKHLRRGCLTVQHDDQGLPYRWKVSSLAFKGETDPSGTPATWVVGAPAARAITILERLHPSGTDWLFAPLLVGPGAGSASRTGNAALTVKATNKQLNRLVTWVSDYCAARGRADNIPLVNGRPWRLTTRQFRRTLAWFIARRPGGTIAGAIAYRHVSIQMFEGYAGTSESGFRAEVESEQALARGEHLLAITDHHEHAQLEGPAAAEASRRLEHFSDRARFQGILITDPRRLQRLMKQEDPAVYPGQYATCVYDHTKALCRQHQALSGRTHPDLSGCRPLTCRNVALTDDNITAWRAELTSIEKELQSRPPLPPLLQQQLQNRHKEVVQFLAHHPGTP